MSFEVSQVVVGLGLAWVPSAAAVEEVLAKLERTVSEAGLSRMGDDDDDDDDDGDDD